MNELLLIDLLVDVENIESSLFKIYKELRPNAEKSKTIFKELKGGFINLSYILYPENDIANAIVFRTFGKKLDDKEMLKLTEQMKNQNLADGKSSEISNFKDMMFNRTNEALVMHSISQHELCKPVYAKYLNGMCFGYAQGITVNGPLMLTNDYLEEFSSKLAKFHSMKIEIPGMDTTTQYDKMSQQFGPTKQSFIEFISAEVEKIKEFPFNEYPKITKLMFEDQFLKDKIKEIGFGEIAFCHNDLNQKNIIWDPQNRKLNFIDFELSMNNYVAFELGQIFFSFTGHFLDEFVEEFLPNDNYRLKFIRRYLEKRYEIKNEKPKAEIFEDEVQKLFIRSSICLLMFLNKISLMALFFEFMPQVFKLDEKNQVKDNLPYYHGRYGLKVCKSYSKNKDNLMKPYEDFIKNKD